MGAAALRARWGTWPLLTDAERMEGVGGWWATGLR